MQARNPRRLRAVSHPPSSGTSQQSVGAQAAQPRLASVGRDTVPSADVSRRMSRTVGRDNPRELRIRSALHAQGLRFRVQYAAVIGTRRTVDIAFPGIRLAVLCDGCFWHGCPLHSTIPKSNRDWWIAKIATNVARDRDTDTRLDHHGWIVLRIWEHVQIDEAVRIITARHNEVRKVRGGSSRTKPTVDRTGIRD
jgi:DNA mismatch endonuclease, patch repair protein